MRWLHCSSSRQALLAALLLLALAPRGAHAAAALPLLGERFLVTAEWRTADGSQGVAEAVPLTEETGLFWFFSPTNIELVVKLLDACAPYGRFWVFASGLTDVEVTLTVEDTWSRQTEQYHHAAGTLFAPLADTGSFAHCALPGPLCGHGTSEAIHASPRPDADAEWLALLLGDQPAADDALYERFHADLEAIRALDAQLEEGAFQSIWWEPHSLLLGLTAPAHGQAQAGTYHEWDCLNAWYRGAADHVFSFPSVVLRFDGMLHPFRIGPDYVALEGVTYAEANFLGWPSAGPSPTPGLCAIADGSAFDYFLEGAPWRYFRVSAPGAAPTLIGTWDGVAPAPSWKARLDQCYEQLDLAAQH